MGNICNKKNTSNGMDPRDNKSSMNGSTVSKKMPAIRPVQPTLITECEKSLLSINSNNNRSRYRYNNESDNSRIELDGSSSVDRSSNMKLSLAAFAK